MKHQLKVGILVGMVVCIGFIICLFSYWSLEGIVFHRIFDKDQIVLQTNQTIYHRGDIVMGTFTACKKSTVLPVVQWSIIDTYLRTYPTKKGVVSKAQCYINKTIEIEPIADSLPDDSYYFSGSATYQINPIKTIVIPLVTNRFEVN